MDGLFPSRPIHSHLPRQTSVPASAHQSAGAIIINPTGIIDAIKAFEGPVRESHISDICAVTNIIARILADSVAPLLSVGIDQRQQLLEITDVVTRLERILDLLKTDQQAA